MHEFIFGLATGFAVGCILTTFVWIPICSKISQAFDDLRHAIDEVSRRKSGLTKPEHGGNEEE